MPEAERMRNRRAIEALRAGVPNRDAVLALGSTQPEIEANFREQLLTLKQSLVDGSLPQGMLVKGSFGAGKSHLLEFLSQIALRENFVCSKVVISKETPFTIRPSCTASRLKLRSYRDEWGTRLLK